MSRKRKFFKLKPKDKRVQFILKTPKHGKGRASFSITKKIFFPGKKSEHETLRLESLEAINLAYKNKGIVFERALIHAKQIVQELYDEYRRTLPSIIHNEENLQILDQYWNKEFEDKDLVDPSSSYNRLARSVEAIGHLSLRSSSKEDLQKEVDSRFKGNKQRNVISALNQILKYLGRNIRLRKMREEIRDVRYLNESEFEKMLSFIEDPKVRLIHIVSFATGMRLGEVFALRLQDIKNGVVNVATQIDRLNLRRATKNRKPRKTLIMDAWIKEVQEWAEIPFNERNKIRLLSFSKITKAACVKAFPKDTLKHCVTHDMRHGYAVNLVSKGISLSQVAQALGDSVVVAEKHYTGFVLSPESIDLMKRILKKA